MSIPYLHEVKTSLYDLFVSNDQVIGYLNLLEVLDVVDECFSKVFHFEAVD